MGDLSRQYCKHCDPRDFADERFAAMVHDILPERDPAEFVERKAWEFATLALALEDLGHLNDGSDALGVGVGDERFVFWLANRAGRVVATDIYGDGEFAEREAGASMLADPRSHAPFPYREDRLEVRWMDGRELAFADASFDVVFSISSIEHFGSPADTAQAAREIGRVLRPGGHAVIATECFVRHHPLDRAPVDAAVRAVSLNTKRRKATLRRRGVIDEVFTPRELRCRIVEPSGLELMQPLTLGVAPEAWDNLTVTHPDGRLEPRTGAHWPHVLLRYRRSVFTSVCLVLEKPG